MAPGDKFVEEVCLLLGDFSEDTKLKAVELRLFRTGNPRFAALIIYKNLRGKDDCEQVRQFAGLLGIPEMLCSL